MTDGRRRVSPLVLFALVLAVVLGAVALDAVFFTRSPPGPSVPSLVPGTTPIQRIIVLMKENHAFDNYFGTYPGVDGIPPNVTLPDGSGGTVSPHWLDATSTPDLPHDRQAMIGAYDNGSNDGFAAVANAAGSGLGNVSVGYYDYRELAGYWGLASNFTLADRYFASMLGPTIPNRMYSIAGTAAGLITNPLRGMRVDVPTIFDQLQARGISWRYYYSTSLLFDPTPLYVAHIAANASMAANLVPLSHLAGDIMAGNLPSVTYIDPSSELPGALAINEHPPGDVTTGEAWTLGIVASLMASPMWNTSALLITYDESGGFYDHVPPPQVDEWGYGFRVPMIVVSPFAKRSFVDHGAMDHTSILKLIAANWNLPSLTPREANASDMLSAFSFPNGTVSGASAGVAGSRTPPPLWIAALGFGFPVAAVPRTKGSNLKASEGGPRARGAAARAPSEAGTG